MMRNTIVETKMGTWGMVLKPNRSYKVVFDQPFHLRMAVLSFSGFSQQDYSFGLMLLDNSDDRVPLTVCVLNKQNALQSRLDLEFEKDDDVTFFVKTEAFNKDTNSFSVHLTGKTTRDPEVFTKRPTTLALNKNNELRQKARSGSLPDEYFEKRGLRSSRNVPSPLCSPVRPSATSPSILTLPEDTTRTSESMEEDPPMSPRSKEAKDKKGSVKSGEVFGKVGKFFSKS